MENTSRLEDDEKPTFVVRAGFIEAGAKRIRQSKDDDEARRVLETWLATLLNMMPGMKWKKRYPIESKNESGPAS